MTNIPDPDALRRCPICGEMIKAIAKKCRYCREFLDSPGLWRERTLLVMSRRAPLPDRCVRTNRPTTRRLRRDLSWHHPAVFITAMSPLIYVILALLLRKTATIHIALSDEWFRKRRRAIFFGWFFALTGIALGAVGFAWADQYDEMYGLILAAIFILPTAALLGYLRASIVRPTRITDRHIWLTGVCEEFLEGLPEFPGE